MRTWGHFYIIKYEMVYHLYILLLHATGLLKFTYLDFFFQKYSFTHSTKSEEERIQSFFFSISNAKLLHVPSNAIISQHVIETRFDLGGVYRYSRLVLLSIERHSMK